jgi:hypothetical protein
MAILSLAAAVSSHAQLVETNIALGKPTAGDVTFGFPTSNGNDDNVATFNHADNLNPPPLNPYWTVDFQGTFDLTRVEIVDRLGCCDPNRLNGSEIRILDINGAQIGAPLLVDGLPPSSPDLVTATRTFDNDGAGWTGAASVRIDGYTQYFQFSEFRAISLQPPPPPMPVNVAPAGLASASGPTWPGLPVHNIIDGNPGSLSHPQGIAGETLGFTYTVNLFRSVAFERLELVNRTGCCPERLTNYRVSLHEDDGSGAPGPAVWSADIRTDGSHSGDGGVDTLTADLDAGGTFAGQFIVVENLSNESYNPQIAELRAFSFNAPPPNLASGKPVTCYDAIGNPTGTWGGFPASNLVDGAPGTFSHPLDQFSANYYYEIDLGADTAIGEVKMNGRLDGCCPERLNNSRLEILNSIADTVFEQEIAGQVVLPVRIPTGNVTGRYLRIINADGADYGPQVGEVIVLAPATAADLFQITAISLNSAAGTGTVTFTSTAGAAYALFGTSNLAAWTQIETNVASDGLSTSEDFNDPDLIGAARRYYRVDKLP